MFSRIALSLLVVCWVALLDATVIASQLDPTACESYQKLQTELEKAGARDHLAKGPAWARANLSPDAVAKVKQLIHVDEQLSFRCPRPKPVALVEEAAVGDIPLPVRNPERPVRAAAAPMPAHPKAVPKVVPKVVPKAAAKKPARPAAPLRPSLPPLPAQKPAN